MSLPSEVIDKVVKNLSANPGVAALVLAGSRAEGAKFPSDKFSDIELYAVAFDNQFIEVEKEVQKIQEIFGENVILAYKNQWAGWSILFSDLLRLEVPIAKASDKNIFTRFGDPKIQVLYSSPNYKLEIDKSDLENEEKKSIDNEIKDFWYMAVYATQHIGRGEIWQAREAIRISMQGKIKKLIHDINHSNVEVDKRNEFVWSEEEKRIIKETSSAYDREDLIQAIFANIKYAKELLKKSGTNLELFQEYENKLLPEINKIIFSP